MNNKGFTLIEITAVVMLLALLLLLVLPKVLEVKENSNEKISNNVKKILYSDAGEYVRTKLNDQGNNVYTIKAGNVFCISVNTLINANATSVDVSDFRSSIIRVSVDENNNFNYSMPKTCTEVTN